MSLVNPAAFKAANGKSPRSMLRGESAIHEIENIVHHNKGHKKNLVRILNHTRGQFMHASTHIVQTEKPVVRIITGFFIEKAHGGLGAAETDGPLAAAQLALLFEKAGVECCVVTDNHCQKVCRAALEAAGVNAKLETVTYQEGDTVRDHTRRWEQDNVTHVIAIERPGPSQDGTMRNMRGEVIERSIPLHDMFGDKWINIAAIDRGNEMGGGSLPHGIVAKDIPNGSKIASTVQCDYLLMSRVSNWAAQGLAGSLGIMGGDKWRDAAIEALDEKTEKKIIDAMLQAGAVDGITHKNDFLKPTIDTFTMDAHRKVTSRIVGVLQAYKAA